MASELNSCRDLNAGSNKLRVELDFRVEAGNWPALEVLETLMDATFAALMDNQSFCQACQVMDGSELSLLFTDDSHITAINAEFRGQEKPTNVLSFPQQEADCDVFGPYLGDIVLAFETIFREADLEKKDFNHHLQHLMVHGFLHLVGYDHETDDEAVAMESLEIDILRDLKIDDPYRDMTKK